MRRWLLWAVASSTVLVVVLVVAIRFSVSAEKPPLSITASSSAPGTSPDSLVGARPSGVEAVPPRGVGKTISDPPAGATERPGAQAAWESNGEADGAQLELRWDEPIDVSRIRIDGAGGPESAFRSVLVVTDEGPPVLVTADSAGNVSTSVTPRRVTSATLWFVADEDASSVAVSALAFDDEGSLDPDPVGSPQVSVGESGAVNDGAISDGRIGETVSVPVGGWVGYSWGSPTVVSAAQIAGSTAADVATSGTLVFSDGSTMEVSGIAHGADPVTTLAFPARTVEWVRLDLPEGAALGEFRVYGAGVTPPRWPAETGIAVSPAAATTCDPEGVPRAESAPTLACPAIGTAVGKEAQLTVLAPPGSSLRAEVWDPSQEAVVAVGAATADADGVAALDIDLRGVAEGPFGVRVTYPEAAHPLSVQLYRVDAEARPESDGYAPPGMTLQFEEEFREPLAVSQLGTGTRYAATKPAGSGGSEFGDAIFADPAWGADTLATLDEEYLRIRIEPATRADPYGWGRDHISGLLSSARAHGSGLAAQYGYFEARILAPAGIGTWPAFWMLDTGSAARPDDGAGEVDGVELYGHNPAGSCHTLHNWPTNGEVTGPSCFADNGAADWSLAWHDYGVRIRPNGADFFIDGRLVTSKEGLLRHDSAYFFLVNLALGGGWPIDLAATAGFAEMYVDWVRVYT